MSKWLRLLVVLLFSAVTQEAFSCENLPVIDDAQKRTFGDAFSGGPILTPEHHQNRQSEEFGYLFSSTIAEGNKLFEEGNKEEMSKKLNFINNLYEVKARTIYNLRGNQEDPFLPDAKILTPEDIRQLFHSYGIGDSILSEYDSVRLWQLCIRAFQLPQAQLEKDPESFEELFRHYRGVVHSLIETFDNRLEEDVLTFEFLTLMAGEKVQLDIKSVDEFIDGGILMKIKSGEKHEPDEFKARFDPHQRLDFSFQKQVVPSEVFQMILQRYGYDSKDREIEEKWFQRIFPKNKPEELFRRVCGALSAPVLSWNDPKNQTLEVRMRKKQRASEQADITDELMESVNRILGRYLNRRALHIIAQRFCEGEKAIKRAQPQLEDDVNPFF